MLNLDLSNKRQTRVATQATLGVIGAFLFMVSMFADKSNSRAHNLAKTGFSQYEVTVDEAAEGQSSFWGY
ncbi:hypothetical protein [Pleionea sp. CnH1-48]|uniref:hypothetical protein n=1 Tax=Pleionea sp. CnH1-48 TaxID=2954494 RepID=UPI002096E796|nr:hypothetical protein [Pleionea sp. CnH1-48]MCO7225446.1 hypothetical protein [Pleionea sp. CnH1-48]